MRGSDLERQIILTRAEKITEPPARDVMSSTDNYNHMGDSPRLISHVREMILMVMAED